MKIIHAADLHLGSRLSSRFPPKLAQERRDEVRRSLRRLVAYAVDNGVSAVLFSGDVFDSPSPPAKEAEFFCRTLESAPEVRFFLLLGNHDGGLSLPLPKNCTVFSPTWQSHDLGGVWISGIEITEGNAHRFYTEVPCVAGWHIVMLHGQVSSSAGVDRIVLKDLRGRGIDYLALGHVHAHEMGAIDQKTKWAYSGCLSGRGFDETGEKGFVLLTVEDTVRAEFVPVSEHPIYEIEGDVSGVRDLYEAADRLRSLIPSPRAICRFCLTGEVAKEVSLSEERIAEELSGDCAFASVKNRTRPILPLEEYQKELSLRGEFVRTVLAREDLDEEDRNAILLFGLRALEGGELLCD